MKFGISFTEIVTISRRVVDYASSSVNREKVAFLAFWWNSTHKYRLDTKSPHQCGEGLAVFRHRQTSEPLQPLL